ncbi:MAG: bifunctional diguanylate cyclase/phosphodiesterase [Gammaproteobacteria bacterium]|nr:bifunctional diguanylate cyclase/phosphodiesterase [Gammaproteobacteria bacterium]
MLLNRLSLTTSMLILTVTVGLVVWAISDSYQHEELNDIFYVKLKERFNDEVSDQRIRFDRQVKSYYPAVRTYAAMVNIRDYLESVDWSSQQNIEIIDHKWPPAWLPGLSMMRRFVIPRYALLLDSSNKVREIYRYKNPMLADELINMEDDILNSSFGQSYITEINNKLYVIASAFVGEEDESPRLLIISPLDEAFLLATQNVADKKHIALLDDKGERVLVSSSQVKIPAGVLLSSLKDDYLTTVAGHLGSGSSDLLMQFASFVSTEDVRQQTAEVLNADRQIRLITAIAYILAFASIMYWVTSRIQRLTKKVIEFSGDMDIQQPESIKKDELLELEDRFELLVNAIKAETAALEHQALHDPLTNMPNRKLLNDRVQLELLKSKYKNSSFLLMVSDLNRFKEVNDTLGHHIGDKVLKQASERLKNALRRDDLVARLGGDEFGILLPNTSMSAADTSAQKIVDLFNKPIIVDGHSLNIGISIGITEYPTHGENLNILMQRADVAMYNAKQNGLGYSLYKSEEDQNSVDRLALMNEFRIALENNELQLYYQPKVDAKTGKIISVEALLRWKHEERGFISPDIFIPLAEQTGLILSLTIWVFNRAFSDWNIWKKQGHDISIAINMSVYCLQSTNLSGTIESLLKEYNVPASHCILELTESLFMKNIDQAKHILNQLDQLGVGLSLDDFGTGYSSLAYLKQLPMDELKIDRSFIMDMINNENDAIIVKATLDMAHAMGLRVVAEGVEDEETLELLIILGCEIIQGYFFSKPIPIDEMSQLLATQTLKR